MPRRSLRDQRREQILDAYEVCVARYGVEGASLERVAEEAGLARPLIRHNIGNREELLDALVARFEENSAESIRQLLAALPAEKRLMTLIEWLFDPASADPTMVLVSNALTAAGAQDPKLARSMRAWTRDFVAEIAAVAATEHPAAEDEVIQAVAAGIASAFFTVESTTPLGRMSDLRQACKAAALRLAETLET